MARQLNIWLADLTHTGAGRLATENMPLNLGMLAAYVSVRFADAVRVRLFKYPDKLLTALQGDETCDLFGCSAYVWNDALGEWFCSTAKRLRPGIVTVRGGWNFPLLPVLQQAYLRAHPGTDVFCRYEGEPALSGIVERLLAGNNPTGAPLAGCAFLHDGEMVSGDVVPRLTSLENIPSPYTGGLLDEFFDGRLTPLLETTRGCPFTCNYCNNADRHYSRVVSVPTARVLEELRYIAPRAAACGVRNLIIADTNFGMYERDVAVADEMRRLQERYGWPLGVVASTGKQQIPRVAAVAGKLAGGLIVSMSVQSLNPATMRLIGRENLDDGVYAGLSRELAVRNLAQLAEVIVPLPEETLTSYRHGVRRLIALGATRVISYTLQMNNGTPYTDPAYRERFGYRTAWRLIPFDFGEYGGERVFDAEQVGIATGTLSFDDYLAVRRFALLTELLYNNAILAELLRWYCDRGGDVVDFLELAEQALPQAPAAVRAVFDSFTAETQNELFPDRVALEAFYDQPENYARLLRGEIGGNVIFRHKAMMLRDALTAWIAFTFDLARRDLSAAAAAELADVREYAAARLDGLFDGKAEKAIERRLQHDVSGWLASPVGTPLAGYRQQETCRTIFSFAERQQIERDDLFTRYGDDPLGAMRILARVPSLERLCRTVTTA